MRTLLSLFAAIVALSVPGVVRAQGLSPQPSTEELSGWRYYPGGPAWNEYTPYPFWTEAGPAEQYYGPRPRSCWRINRWGEVRPRRWC